MQKYAVVVSIHNYDLVSLDKVDSFIANADRPYFVPENCEDGARKTLSQRFPRSMIIIADKETLLNNPFNLGNDDFKNCLTIE